MRNLFILGLVTVMLIFVYSEARTTLTNSETVQLEFHVNLKCGGMYNKYLK